ncbi:MAG: hypothetical protein ACRCU3_11200 [Eubacteriaceae bacterium]
MVNKIKKAILGKVAIVTLAALLLMGTFAWFVASDSIVNAFKAQFIFNVNLEESFTPRESVKDGETIEKRVSVTNTRDVEAFVRVMVFPVITKDGKPLEAQIGNQIELKNLNTTQWIDGEDGYYYYLKTLKKGETAETLFTDVVMNFKGNTSYEDGLLEIIVKSEAIDTNQYNYRLSWWGNLEAPTSPKRLAVDDQLKTQIKE